MPEQPTQPFDEMSFNQLLEIVIKQKDLIDVLKATAIDSDNHEKELQNRIERHEKRYTDALTAIDRFVVMMEGIHTTHAHRNGHFEILRAIIHEYLWDSRHSIYASDEPSDIPF